MGLYITRPWIKLAECMKLRLRNTEEGLRHFLKKFSDITLRVLKWQILKNELYIVVPTEVKHPQI